MQRVRQTTRIRAVCWEMGGVVLLHTLFASVTLSWRPSGECSMAPHLREVDTKVVPSCMVDTDADAVTGHTGNAHACLLFGDCVNRLIDDLACGPTLTLAQPHRNREPTLLGLGSTFRTTASLFDPTRVRSARANAPCLPLAWRNCRH